MWPRSARRKPRRRSQRICSAGAIWSRTISPGFCRCFGRHGRARSHANYWRRLLRADWRQPARWLRSAFFWRRMANWRVPATCWSSPPNCGGVRISELLSRLARVAYKQRDFQGALGYLVHARDLTPENAGVHYFIGVVASRTESGYRGRQGAHRSGQARPANPDYNYALGAVKSQLNLFTEALPYFQRYRDARPDDPKGRLALGAAYYNVKDDARARRNWIPRRRDRRTAAGAHYYLGRIAFRAGEYEAAAKAIQPGPGSESEVRGRIRRARSCVRQPVPVQGCRSCASSCPCNSIRRGIAPI